MPPPISGVIPSNSTTCSTLLLSPGSSWEYSSEQDRQGPVLVECTFQRVRECRYQWGRGIECGWAGCSGHHMGGQIRPPQGRDIWDLNGEKVPFRWQPGGRDSLLSRGNTSKRPPWVSRTKLHILLAEQGALCWQDPASPDKGNRWFVQGFHKCKVLGLADLQNHLGTDWALVVEVWLPEWGHCWWACFRSPVQRRDYWCKVVIHHFWHLFATVAKARACLVWDLESWQASTGRWTTWIYLPRRTVAQLWWVWLADVASCYFLQDPLQIKTHCSPK